jgi:hypothetical protein
MKEKQVSDLSTFDQHFERPRFCVFSFRYHCLDISIALLFHRFLFDSLPALVLFPVVDPTVKLPSISPVPMRSPSLHCHFSRSVKPLSLCAVSNTPMTPPFQEIGRDVKGCGLPRVFAVVIAYTNVITKDQASFRSVMYCRVLLLLIHGQSPSPQCEDKTTSVPGNRPCRAPVMMNMIAMKAVRIGIRGLSNTIVMISCGLTCGRVTCHEIDSPSSPDLNSNARPDFVPRKTFHNKFSKVQAYGCDLSSRRISNRSPLSKWNGEIARSNQFDRVPWR